MKSKLTPICKIPFSQRFKWHGEKYIQIKRYSKCKIGQLIIVRREDAPCERMRFPSGRLVKPVIKCNI
jgi:hypothetical protein